METRAHQPVRAQLFHFASPLGMALTLVVIGLAALLGPSDRALGGSLRLILLHGAWVWTGMILFAGAGLAGLAALAWRRTALPRASLALSRAGLAYWLTYLPMSMLVMQLSWGGMFFDEPRWRIPFSFAVIAVLLQLGLLLINRPLITSLGNAAFAAALWISLRSADAVLHPDSPITQSSLPVQVSFFVLLALALLLGGQLSLFLYRRAALR